MHPILSQNNNINIFPIKAFKDNYIWVIQEKLNGIIVDPGDAKPVLKKLKEKNISLIAILITHKHYDHTGGVEELINNHPDVQIFGPKNIEFKFKYTIVKEDDVISILGTKVKFNVIETPGHTLDHIIYVDTDHLFCGDTLFACGCGRLFEFALTIDKENNQLNERYKRLRDVEITIPSILKEELETNPFLRAKTIEEFKLIRKRKDEF